MRAQIEIPLQFSRFVRANWLTLFFQWSVSLRSYLFFVGLANEIDWSKNLAISVISKIFISDIAWIVKWFVTRSDTMIGWGRLCGCHACHTNNPRLWWRLNQAHSRRRFRVSLPSGSVFVRIEEMEKFAEFVSSIGQNARSSPYMPPNAPVPRVTAAPNSPPANYVSCDLARQHPLSMSTQSQAGNVKFCISFSRIVFMSGNWHV